MSSNIRGKKTQAEVLDIAWALISEQGADVSLSKIASAAGISRQTVYLHFGTRGGLLVALVRRADERFEIKQQFDAALEIPDPKERLTATLRAWLGFVPKIYPVAKDLIRLRDTDPEAAGAWEDRMTDLRAWLKILMQSLAAEGRLKPDWTADTASQFFWAQTSVQVWGLLRFECGWGEGAVSDKLHQTILANLLREEEPRR